MYGVATSPPSSVLLVKRSSDHSCFKTGIYLGTGMYEGKGT